uniref:Uncharacterized protein n=1 Tax=Steinernema glaseri TaxID=37863 RepID=A0A1I7ZMJ5_9BILA
MDTIPYDFVASVMRVRLSGLRFDEFNECALLGANYGTIATEIAERTLDCFVDILGDDFYGLNGEVSRPPLFRTLTKKEYVDVASFSPSCRNVACRRLSLRGFYSDTLYRQLDSFLSAPHMTSFFNAVVLQYQESASFKKLFLMIADTMMLKLLRLDVIEDMSNAPLWLQDTLTRVFFQPQFDRLTFLPQRSLTCSWTNALVDSLVVRWMETPETFPKTSKTVIHPYQAPLIYSDLLSKYKFHQVKRTCPQVSRRFDCVHPMEVERRLVASVFTNNGYAYEFTNVTDDDDQLDSSGYLFCSKARYMALTFAFNDGDMALSRTNLNCSPKTVKQEQQHWARRSSEVLSQPHQNWGQFLIQWRRKSRSNRVQRRTFWVFCGQLDLANPRPILASPTSLINTSDKLGSGVAHWQEWREFIAINTVRTQELWTQLVFREVQKTTNFPIYAFFISFFVFIARPENRRCIVNPQDATQTILNNNPMSNDKKMESFNSGLPPINPGQLRSISTPLISAIRTVLPLPPIVIIFSYGVLLQLSLCFFCPQIFPNLYSLTLQETFDLRSCLCSSNEILP